jgi:hypothetical protein
VQSLFLSQMILWVNINWQHSLLDVFIRNSVCILRSFTTVYCEFSVLLVPQKRGGGGGGKWLYEYYHPLSAERNIL